MDEQTDSDPAAASYTARIREVLNARGVRSDCSECGATTRFVADFNALFLLTVGPLGSKEDDADTGAMACAALVCKQCGATTFHRLITLGLIEGVSD